MILKITAVVGTGKGGRGGGGGGGGGGEGEPNNSYHFNFGHFYSILVKKLRNRRPLLEREFVVSSIFRPPFSRYCNMIIK